jgi:ornithine decarboxylase
MCGKEQQYTDAIDNALELYQMAKEEGYTLQLLDIGGGFPGFHTYKPTFPEFAAIIRENLKDRFGDKKIEIVAEPGTYFAASTHILVCNVIAKRILDNRFIYYINDGFYGGIGPIWHCLIKPKLNLLKEESEQTYSSTVFGPTCDSIDLIYDDIQLPELNIGDWLYLYETVIGAYGANLVTQFNGFGTEKKYYIWRK